jgi:hypothetical protein
MNSERMRAGDTTGSFHHLFIKLDTVCSNDSPYSDLIAKTYSWTQKKNTTKTKKANPYHEKGTHQMCIEIWRQNHSYNVKVIERCFYRVIGDTEYVWNEEFWKYYSDIRELTKILKE